MDTIELKECKIYSDRVHVCQVCKNKFNHCWKFAIPKSRMKVALKYIKNFLLIGKELLEDRDD